MNTAVNAIAALERGRKLFGNRPGLSPALYDAAIDLVRSGAAVEIRDGGPSIHREMRVVSTGALQASFILPIE